MNLGDTLRDTNDCDDASASAEAYRFILGQIRRGSLTPGARVRTADIAVQVGLSRQPVREAIRQLEAEGYLVTRPNRGARVSKLTMTQLLELLEIRASLEGLAAKIIAANARTVEFGLLKDALECMRAAGTETNAWLAAHADFHLQVVAAAQRPRLAREIARLHAAVEPYLRMWFLHAGTPAAAYEDHGRILTALQSGYPRYAEELVSDHVLETAPSLMKYLRSIGQAEIDGDDP